MLPFSLIIKKILVFMIVCVLHLGECGNVYALGDHLDLAFCPIEHFFRYNPPVGTFDLLLVLDHAVHIPIDPFCVAAFQVHLSEVSKDLLTQVLTEFFRSNVQMVFADQLIADQGPTQLGLEYRKFRFYFIRAFGLFSAYLQPPFQEGLR